MPELKLNAEINSQSSVYAYERAEKLALSQPQADMISSLCLHGVMLIAVLTQS